MNFARIISGLAHPMLMPLYSIFVIFHSGTYLDYTPPQLMRVIYLIVAISTILLPLSVLPLLKAQKMMHSFSMEDKKERILPLTFSVIFYTLGFYLLMKFPLTRVIADLQLAAIISIALVTLISFKWKISIHMAGIGGFLGMLLAFTLIFGSSMRSFFMAGLILAGILAYSRLKLNLHTPSQVYAGFALGFVVIFSTLLLLA